MQQGSTSTVSKIHETVCLSSALSIDVDQRAGRCVGPGMIESGGEPIRNPITGDPHRARIDMPHGFEYTVAEVASGTSRATGEIELDIVNGHGHLANLHLTQSGVVR